MTISPVLLYIWGGLFLAFMALLVYRGQLTRYEDEQLFLGDDAGIIQHNKERRNVLVDRLQRIKPLFAACATAAGVVTAAVVSIYVYNAWQNIQ